MSPDTSVPKGTQIASLLEDFSLEISGKDAEAVKLLSGLLPAGTRINITFLGNEGSAERVAAAAAVRDVGLVPVPHFSARRLGSVAEFRDGLSQMADVGATKEVFLVGGDPTEPQGPFPDALSLIRTGLLPEYGVEHVGIAGYPEGHPDINIATLWTAMHDKIAALAEQSLGGVMTTQFSFDSAAVVEWVATVRGEGVDLPLRIGVPGPTSVKRLVAYARRCGVKSTTGIAQKYGFSLGRLLGTAGPDRFVDDLASGIDPARHGDVRLHLYTFGGVDQTAQWVREAIGKVST